ncbi:hypothetical protein OLMES_4430 [Oleiphilus messinensis]|uniref:Uncharacterized protein n=1 Tax=Oleiphilus messinensis TaxID=141451 RepID=A0A1Y0IF54_9GAMM|nr:hypothetical protein OLMES_4430 [Oleiphilus messinensis]
MLVCPENIELDRYRKLAAVCLHPVSGRVVLDLAKAISGDGITTPNGDHYHALLQQLGYGFPILSLAGSADLQCPPEAAARFGTEHRIFGRAYGEQVDYGHDDLVLGKFAPDETWPVILEWLDR